MLTVEFTLDGTKYVGLNGGPQFTFSEAISFQIMCADQDEVDHYWTQTVRRRRGGPMRLAQGPVRPVLAGRADPALTELLQDPDPDRANRAMQAMLKMRKLDIAELERAADAVPA